jgi:hypothetical protein
MGGIIVYDKIIVEETNEEYNIKGGMLIGV